MWQFFLAGASVISAYGQMQAGRAAQAAANAEAMQYEQERKQNEVIAMQRHVDRLEQYDAARAHNLAWFSFANRDISDRSIRAFMDKQREVAYSDVARSDAQGYAEGSQLAMQAQVSRMRGVAARKSANIQALSTLASGLYQYNTVKV